MDLSEWKYVTLRDTVNTSTDIALLEACRQEFHRRLKVYNDWKAKNAARTGATEQRAPQQVLLEAKKSNPLSQTAAGSSQPGRVNNAQRYFRVPFVRPVDQHVDKHLVKSGWWYAHFDGDYIVRQMEIYPNMAPSFFVAGKDDMQICELSLEESGLSRKKGAEIIAQEFEQIWITNGGIDYLLKAISSGQARPR